MSSPFIKFFKIKLAQNPAKKIAEFWTISFVVLIFSNFLKKFEIFKMKKRFFENLKYFQGDSKKQKGKKSGLNFKHFYFIMFACSTTQKLVEPRKKSYWG